MRTVGQIKRQGLAGPGLVALLDFEDNLIVDHYLQAVHIAPAVTVGGVKGQLERPIAADGEILADPHMGFAAVSVRIQFDERVVRRPTIRRIRHAAMLAVLDLQLGDARRVGVGVFGVPATNLVEGTPTAAIQIPMNLEATVHQKALAPFRGGDRDRGNQVVAAVIGGCLLFTGAVGQRGKDDLIERLTWRDGQIGFMTTRRDYRALSDQGTIRIGLPLTRFAAVALIREKASY